MGRLFWKFFIAFWLAQLLVAWGAGMLVWLYHEDDRNARHSPHAVFMVRAAADILTSQGEAPLKTLLQHWQQEDRMQLYVIDDQGHELLGRKPVPEALKSSSKQTVRAPDGKQYQLFALDAPLPPPFMDGGKWLPPPPEDALAPDHRPGPPLDGLPLPHALHEPQFPWIHLIAGLLASLVFSGLLAWYVVKPIRHLRRAFGAAAAGNLEIRVQPLMGTRRDEIADLGRDFDHMTSQLQALIGMQRKLFHHVSHELRSPLARMQTAIGLARQSPEKMGTALIRVEREADKLDELVGELLTLARLDAGMAGPMDEEIDMSELLESIIDDARFEAESHDCVLESTISGEVTLHGQSALLYRAIENIVRNAIKHTHPDTFIEVHASVDGQSKLFRLRVSDRGPGVPEPDLEHIFEPFFRSRASHQNGYGLGLAIARRAIEAHGGTVKAGNRVNGGLKVDITLPMVDQPAQ